jgi:subtilisin family serine protease
MREPKSICSGRGVVALMFVVSVLLASVGGFQPGQRGRLAAAQDEPVPSGDVIVILDSDGDSASQVEAAAVDDGIQPTVVFTTVVDGYAATVTQAQAEELADDPNVAAIFPNNPVYEASQTIPAGVKRIGADQNDIANINGIDQRVNVDVAVLDSGIDSHTGDLNVAGGFDCAGAGTYEDESGHGTHVSGTIGALDNNIGVVGVAPGARLWSVRVLDGNGIGSDATLICGLDWVYSHRSTIDVVNMSVTGSGQDKPCTRSSNEEDWESPLHEAVCKVYDADIPIVAAAGNQYKDASTTTPATFDEVIAVSAFADYDGLSGGLGTGCSAPDDYFFHQSSSIGSNFGADVDILAPGVCVLSTAMGGGTGVRTGTSMAAPHVTGAVALFMSQNSNADVEDAKSWLFDHADAQTDENGILGGDPDGFAEPVLRVGLGDVSMATVTPTPSPTVQITPPTGAYKIVNSDNSSNGVAHRYVRDNNLSTIWTTKKTSKAPSSAWVLVRLQNSQPVGSIRWVFGITGMADSFYIETSNDLVTWKKVTTKSNKPAGQWQEAMTKAGTTAKYVRFTFTNPNHDLQLGGIAEIQLWAPGAPVLYPTVTPTKTPKPTKYSFTTSQTVNSQGGNNVKDGKAATYWRSKTSSTVPPTAAVQVSLGTKKHVGVVRWMFGLEGVADVLKIDVSWDQVSWTNVATRTNAPLYEWQELVVNLDAKYVRWTVINPNDDNPIGGIAEIEVWSGPGGPITSVTLPASPTETPTGEATQTPTATETGTPTATPEITPTGSETVEATQTPTPTPTSTPTDTPTETVEPTQTEAPTETATLEPTATSTPTETATEEGVSGDEVVEPSAIAGPAKLAVRGARKSAGSASANTLFDEDPQTVWITAEDSPEKGYIILDMGRRRDLGEVRWLFSSPYASGDYIIEISEDRRTWTTIVEPGELRPDEWQTTPVNAVARYVRFTFTNTAGAPYLGGLAEVELYAQEE